MKKYRSSILNNQTSIEPAARLDTKELRKKAAVSSSSSFLNKTIIALAITHTISLPLEAATILVNTLQDPSLPNMCSLRDAINSANNDETPLNSNCVAGDEDDIIELSGLNGEITLADELPVITSNITLQGPGQDDLNISGNNAHRILRATGDSILTIDNLTLSNGTAFAGGAVYIRNSVNLTISNTTITGNSAVIGAAVASFSYNPAGRPSININNSTLSDNSVSNLGGAINSYASDSLIISNSTLFGNSANTGGGAINADGLNSLTISSSTLSANSSSNFGGAVLVQNIDNARISNSTLSGNSASINGGALRAIRSDNLVIINNTMTENEVDVRGGAFYADTSENLYIYNNIFSGNNSSDRGSEIFFRGSSAISSNNLLGDNSNSFDDAFDNFDPVMGNFSPSASSIIATSTTASGSVNPNATSVSSIIGSLANNGGTMLTHELIQGSPAINQGDNLICAAVPINNLDQLGNMRPSDGVCDIGSIEFIGTSSPPEPEASFFVVPVTGGKSVIFSL